MEIHGLRLYPQTIRTVRGAGAPIFVHGRLSDDCNDFLSIFRPLAPRWRTHTFVTSFDVAGGEDALPGLREQFGPSLIDVQLDSQLMFLRGDDLGWADGHSDLCYRLGIFREVPTFDLARCLFWDIDFRLTPDTWPLGLTSLVHCWDDMYWQLFSTDRADVEALVEAHDGDPRLAMYLVDLEREYPDPSNQELRPAGRGGA
ncbi:hypothetical protein [Aquisphaera insulae]|uniref:hypothetical protein n=1 Tax=Aquisphaera insulae TaxID=2712864 RepID=UPI0013ED952A|nr:hypothetical protein [Aquisphaera insulae]